MPNLDGFVKALETLLIPNNVWVTQEMRGGLYPLELRAVSFVAPSGCRMVLEEWVTRVPNDPEWEDLGISLALYRHGQRPNITPQCDWGRVDELGIPPDLYPPWQKPALFGDSDVYSHEEDTDLDEKQ